MADLDGEDSTKTRGLNAIEVLESIIRHHVSSAEQKSGISFQVIAEIISFGDKKLNSKIYDVIDAYISSIRDILVDGVGDGVIREDIDLDATATLFFSTIQGLVSLWALSNYSFDLEKKYMPVLEVLRNAVRKQ